jgi:hypothetical protein
MDTLGATAEQIDRERARAHRELSGSISVGAAGPGSPPGASGAG